MNFMEILHPDNIRMTVDSIKKLAESLEAIHESLEHINKRLNKLESTHVFMLDSVYDLVRFQRQIAEMQTRLVETVADIDVQEAWPDETN